ncbi:MAG: acylneuraminate cytidylyltransferase family protein [Odoribacter sp.]
MSFNFLYIIPARGGSKGIPHKNIKELGGKPLIYYSIDVARQLTSDENICVSTDDDEIIERVEKYGLKIPFKRPEALATDHVGTYEVLLHALDFYEKKGCEYDGIVLLQPTSPFRKSEHIRQAICLYTSDIDMVVSVKEAATNPYYNAFEEDRNGYLEISKGNGEIERRQDAPDVWEYNGAIYVINIASLKEKTMSSFKRVKKYEMDNIASIDLDTPFDWLVAEMMQQNDIIHHL